MQTISSHDISLQRGAGGGVEQRLFPMAITVAPHLHHPDLAIFADKEVEEGTDKRDKEGAEEGGPKSFHRKTLNDQSSDFKQKSVDDKGKETKTQDIEGESQEEKKRTNKGIEDTEKRRRRQSGDETGDIDPFENVGGNQDGDRLNEPAQQETFHRLHSSE